MVGAVIMLLVVLVALGVIAWLSLARSVEQTEEIEHELNDPATPTVEYAVPEGVDPALLRGCLTRAGFVSTVEETPRFEVVKVACDPADRERVREAIEHAPVDLDRTAELKDAHGAVRFIDESHAA